MRSVPVVVVVVVVVVGWLPTQWCSTLGGFGWGRCSRSQRNLWEPCLEEFALKTCETSSGKVSEMN